MSHAEERAEKNCLNCGTIVQGRYCHHCGQENIVPHETFLHMVKHFFYDITHFDGSFFTTVKDLVFKPGFLTKEYIRGRRKSYLHPIRMYVFTSALFFLIFFSMFKIKEGDVQVLTDNVMNNERLFELKDEALKIARSKEDSMAIEKIYGIIESADTASTVTKDTSGVLKGTINSKNLTLDLGGAEKYSSVEEYDSIQKSLPRNKQDGFVTKIITRKLVAINAEYRGKEDKLFRDIADKFLHSIPYLLFVSLPLYALFLKLLYVRRKKYFYADHGIFLIHLYVFTFLLLLIYFGLGRLNEMTDLGVFNFIRGIFIVGGVFYTLKAMKVFYEQRWGRTFLKFIIFNILCLVTAIFLFSVFALFSALFI